MSQPISTVRSDKGPLTATAIETVSITRAVGRARCDTLFIDPFETVFLQTWYTEQADGCHWEDRLVVDYAGAWDVHAIVTGYTDGDTDLTNDQIGIEIQTFYANGNQSDKTYNMRMPLAEYSGGHRAELTPSMPMYVPEVNGEIGISVYSTCEILLYADIEMSAHYICPANFTPFGSG